MSSLRAVADYRQSGSLARRLRERRNQFFWSLLDRLSRPLKILDIGGTEIFWQTLGYVGKPGIEITTLNLEREQGSGLPAPNVTALEGDARRVPFGDGSFDVVFSNSLIEHVGGFDDQQKVADEIRRVGKSYFVQTPNRYFPIEPHFLFPFFQHLPVSARVYLLTHFELSYCGKLADPGKAREAVESVCLLDRATLRALFPEARLWEEKWMGFVKSFVAYGGFPGLESRLPA